MIFRYLSRTSSNSLSLPIEHGQFQAFLAWSWLTHSRSFKTCGVALRVWTCVLDSGRSESRTRQMEGSTESSHRMTRRDHQTSLLDGRQVETDSTGQAHADSTSHTSPHRIASLPVKLRQLAGRPLPYLTRPPSSGLGTTCRRTSGGVTSSLQLWQCITSCRNTSSGRHTSACTTPPTIGSYLDEGGL